MREGDPGTIRLAEPNGDVRPRRLRGPLGGPRPGRRSPGTRCPAIRCSPEAVRTLRYMQDIESHTIIYLRVAPGHPRRRRPRRRDVPRLLALRGDVPRPRAARASSRPPAIRSPPRAAAAGAGAAGQAARGGGDGRRVSKAWPDFCAVHMAWGAINELTRADRLPAARRARRPPRAVGPARAHRARRVAALLLLLPPGRDAARRGRRRRGSRACSSTASGRPWAAACSPDDGAALPRRLSLRRRGGARRRAQGRRDHPAPAGLRHGAPAWRSWMDRARRRPARPHRKEDGMATATAEPYRAYTPRPFTRAERDSTTILFGGLHWRARARDPGACWRTAATARRSCRWPPGGPPHRARGRRHRPVLPDQLHHRQPRQLPQEEVEAHRRRGGGRSATST